MQALGLSMRQYKDPASTISEMLEHSSRVPESAVRITPMTTPSVASAVHPCNAGSAAIRSELGPGCINEPGWCLAYSGLSRPAYQSGELRDIPLWLDLDELESSESQDLGDGVHG